MIHSSNAGSLGRGSPTQHCDRQQHLTLTIGDEVILHCTPQPLGLLLAVHAPEAILHSDLRTQAQGNHDSMETRVAWRGLPWESAVYTAQQWLWRLAWPASILSQP